MKLRVSLFLLFTFILAKGSAIGELRPAGARSIAMGGSSAAIVDFWSTSNNQAGGAWLKGISAGLYAENSFLLKELMFQQIGITLGINAGTFGLIVTRFGDNRYNEIKAGLSYARKFGKHFSMGIQLDYFRISVAEEYGNKNLFSCEIGLMYQSQNHLTIGVHILNPVPVKITDHPAELLPIIVRVGLSYRFSETFIAILEAEKDLEHTLLLRAGTEYRFAKSICARLGIVSNPMSFTFGFGLEFGKIKADLASQYNQSLGFSPSVSIIYSIKTK